MNSDDMSEITLLIRRWLEKADALSSGNFSLEIVLGTKRDVSAANIALMMEFKAQNYIFCTEPQGKITVNGTDLKFFSRQP